MFEEMKKPMERFYIEHGMIHDRNTGRHVTTDVDSEYPAPNIHETLHLLITLSKQAERTDCPANARKVLYNESRKFLGNPMGCVSIPPTQEKL